MRRSMIAALLISLLSAGPVLAQDDALGLYFSDTEFTAGTASITVVQGFMMAGYIVLTNPTGTTINGYEVGIASTAGDFAIPMTSLTFDTNEGTNLNQIITFLTPKPALPDGTVLATIFFTTDSTDLETISFAASSPASLPGELPVIDYASGPLVACSLPFGTSAVAWLNGEPVANDETSWSGVKALFR